MSENLIDRLIPHQGCVITRRDGAIEIAGSAMNWVMSAAVAPQVCRPPFAFRVVGKTDSTNVRELRVLPLAAKRSAHRRRATVRKR